MNQDRNPIGITFESLEDRRLCSATLVSGIVRIQGTDARESVTVSEFVSNIKTTTVRFLRVTETTHHSFGSFDFDTTRTTDFVKSQVTRLRVNSLGGNDVINLNTSVGADVFAGGGSDAINGGAGNDNLFGDFAIPQGDFGQDLVPQLFGTPGNDIINGNAGNDLLRGGPADDRLDGGFGLDAMFGEAGNDTIFARDGVLNETVDGGAGFDTAQVDEDLFGIPRDHVFSIDSIVF